MNYITADRGSPVPPHSTIIPFSRFPLSQCLRHSTCSSHFPLPIPFLLPTFLFHTLTKWIQEVVCTPSEDHDAVQLLCLTLPKSPGKCLIISLPVPLHCLFHCHSCTVPTPFPVPVSFGPLSVIINQSSVLSSAHQHSAYITVHMLSRACTVDTASMARHRQWPSAAAAVKWTTHSSSCTHVGLGPQPLRQRQVASFATAVVISLSY